MLRVIFAQLTTNFDVPQLNVLIDNGEKAVLCDFGLSRIKADVTSRTAMLSGDIVGSRSWMAPERLLGGSLKKPCDIYAFGMTLHEVSAGCVALKSASLIRRCQIFSNDTPFSELRFSAGGQTGRQTGTTRRRGCSSLIRCAMAAC
jgi:serine/threonine protein kinase